MASEKSSAIVLRTVEFSETSLVVTLFTREFGKVRALAKGARRPKGPFESALDLLAVVSNSVPAQIVRCPRPADRSEAGPPLSGGRPRFEPLYAGYYVAELLAELTDTHDPHPELFDAADQALLALDTGASPATTILWLELLALGQVGHAPALDQCAACGREIESASRLPFGLLAGGLLCAACRSGQRQVVSVRAEVVETLRRFSAAAIGTAVDWQSLEVPVDQRGELRGLMSNYLNHLTGHRLRLQAYLHGLTTAD